VFFNAGFWGDLRRQLHTMIRERRAPAWMEDYILFTDDPDEVVAFYRRKLQVL
jgi:predicted Rossmann-fold nucleotide-binding protein